MVQRARTYIRHLEAKSIRVMVPTPVLTEYLIGVPRNDRETHGRILERHFSMPALDIPSAQLAAELQGDVHSMKAIRQNHGVDRQSLRIDAFIVAIAIVHGAQKIVTNDIEHFRELAQGRIIVDEIPDIPETTDQSLMFDL